MQFLIIELKKSRHCHFLCLLCLSLLLTLCWNLFTFGSLTADKLSSGYDTIFYQLPIMNTLLYPILLAVIASRIWDMEFKGNTYKLLFTLQDKALLYKAKTILGLIFCLILSLSSLIVVLLTGRICGFTQNLSLPDLIWLTVFTFAVGTMLYLIQQLFSLKCETQVLPLSIGIIGAFLGILSSFFMTALHYFLPWTYFILFQSVTINWEESTHTTTFIHRPYHLFLLVIVMIISTVFYKLGKKQFYSKEI